MNIKLCVVGPSKTGKSHFCRVLADQPFSPGSEYTATAGVRIQELERTIGTDICRVQLWDCSGSSKPQYWPVLAKGLDGLLLVHDSTNPEQEKELEKWYTSFGQRQRLTMHQCLILGTTWGAKQPQGLQGKLNRLPHITLDLSPVAAPNTLEEGMSQLDALLSTCVAWKKEKLERSVMADMAV